MRIPKFIKAVPPVKALSVAVTVLNGLGAIGSLLSGKVEHYEKEAAKQVLKAEIKQEVMEEIKELLANK